MKRFSWPLQRLLDVTAQREQALRGEIASLAAQAALVVADIRERRAQMTAMLADLGTLELQQRLARQEVLMRCAGAYEQQIDALHKRLTDLRAQRQQKMTQLLDVRSRRQTLEKLRDGAMDRWRAEYARWEQKQTDEAAAMAFARGMIQGRRVAQSEVWQ